MAVETSQGFPPGSFGLKISVRDVHILITRHTQTICSHLCFKENGVTATADPHTNQPIRMGGTFQQYRTVWRSQLQLHHACESLSLALPHRAILLVRARAYEVTAQFPKELVRSYRRAWAVARCMVKLAVILNCM